MDGQLKLYWHKFSLIPWRVRIMLAEKGIKYADEQVNLFTEEPSEEFLALNPFAQIPVIEHGGLVLSESIAIIEYLEEKHPTPPLMPETPEDRAITRQYMCWGTDYWPSAWKKWMAPRMPKGVGEPWTEESVEAGRQELAMHLDVLADQLADKDWLVGHYSLADICYAPLVLALRSVDLGDEVDKRPNIKRWIKRLRSRTAVQSTMMPGV